MVMEVNQLAFLYKIGFTPYLLSTKSFVGDLVFFIHYKKTKIMGGLYWFEKCAIAFTTHGSILMLVTNTTYECVNFFQK